MLFQNQLTLRSSKEIPFEIHLSKLLLEFIQVQMLQMTIIKLHIRTVINCDSVSIALVSVHPHFKEFNN